MPYSSQSVFTTHRHARCSLLAARQPHPQPFDNDDKTTATARKSPHHDAAPSNMSGPDRARTCHLLPLSFPTHCIANSPPGCYPRPNHLTHCPATHLEAQSHNQGIINCLRESCKSTWPTRSLKQPPSQQPYHHNVVHADKVPNRTPMLPSNSRCCRPFPSTSLYCMQLGTATPLLTSQTS